jgi:hypothetical protein
MRPTVQPKKKPPGFAGRFSQNGRTGGETTGDDSVEAGLEILLGLQAHGLLDHLTALEEQQGGDGADSELTGQVLIVVDVDLGDLGLAGVFGGQLVENRTEHLARAAPLGPKIHQHGLSGPNDLGGKVLGGRSDDVGSSHREMKKA